MRILIISNIFPPGFIGGYELGALDVARGLQLAGHEVRILASDFMVDDAGAFPDLSVARVLECVELTRILVPPLEQVRRGTFVNPRNLRRLASELIAFRPDTVLAFNTAGLGTLGLAQFCTGLDIAPVFYLMDDPFKELRRIPRLLESANRTFGGMHFLDAVEFIVMSNSLRAQIEASLGCSLRNVTIIPGWSHPQTDYDGLLPIPPADGSVRFVFRLTRRSA